MTPEEKLEWDRKWREKNREKVRESHRKYYHAHTREILDKKREYKRQWYLKNRERLQEKRHANRERECEYEREYYRNHPWLRAKKNGARRAKLLEVGGSFTIEEINQLFELQHGICPYCNKLLYGCLNDAPHIEHKVPVSRGGSNDISNLCIAHASCNLKKGAKTDEEYFIEIARG